MEIQYSTQLVGAVCLVAEAMRVDQDWAWHQGCKEFTLMHMDGNVNCIPNTNWNKTCTINSRYAQSRARIQKNGKGHMEQI